MTKLFDSINEEDINLILTIFEANTIRYKKDTTILSNIVNINKIGIVQSGIVNIIRYNYDGSRTLIENLTCGDIFGRYITTLSEDLYIISASDVEIIMFDFDNFFLKDKRYLPFQEKIINNLFYIINNKLIAINERIEILTKKTIREKLLNYFNILAKKKISKSFQIPITLTDLADYLAIDRTAMMREIKNLKDEGLIESNGRKIILKY